MEDNTDAYGALAAADEDASPVQLLQTGLTPRLKEQLLDGCTSGADAVGEAAGAGDAAARCGVYVLELENGKYYVGSEEDMERRIEKHKAKTCEHMLLG